MTRAAAPSTIRRRPEQARSRALVGSVLHAAKELLGDNGADNFTMTDLAERSGVRVTAIYRYFPNKDAVLRELARDTYASDAHLTAIPELEPRDIAAFVRDRILEYWELYKKEPFRVPLRSAIHADPEFEAFDRADTRRVAHEMAHAAAPLTRFAPEELEQRVLLVLESTQSAFRLAAHAGEHEADQLIDVFSEIAVAALT